VVACSWLRSILPKGSFLGGSTARPREGHKLPCTTTHENKEKKCSVTVRTPKKQRGQRRIIEDAGSGHKGEHSVESVDHLGKLEEAKLSRA
jgi:hypothetical protein